MNALNELFNTIVDRASSNKKKSYTKNLLKSGKTKIAQKVGEESSELIKIERAEIARYAFLGMTSFHIQGQIQEEFSPESIEPLYYKSSSVEEKSAKI